MYSFNFSSIRFLYPNVSSLMICIKFNFVFLNFSIIVSFFPSFDFIPSNRFLENLAQPVKLSFTNSSICDLVNLGFLDLSP